MASCRVMQWLNATNFIHSNFISNTTTIRAGIEYYYLCLCLRCILQTHLTSCSFLYCSPRYLQPTFSPSVAPSRSPTEAVSQWHCFVHLPFLHLTSTNRLLITRPADRQSFIRTVKIAIKVAYTSAQCCKFHLKITNSILCIIISHTDTS